MMRKVIFLFIHTVLGRIWVCVVEVIAGEGIELKVLNQMQSIDWESFIEKEMPAADAIYFDITRHFSTFPQLLETARGIRYALPAGLETEVAWAGEIDRDAQQRIAAYCKAGTVNDLANAARYLLHRAGVLAEAPAAAGQPILSGIYHAESPQL